jgi:hypothetical protein
MTESLRVTFERSGGLMGNPIGTTVDATTLKAEETQQIERWLTDAHFFELPKNLTSPAAVDRFQYQIDVHFGCKHHTLHASESALPDGLRPLVSWLMDKVLSPA